MPQTPPAPSPASFLLVFLDSASQPPSRGHRLTQSPRLGVSSCKNEGDRGFCRLDGFEGTVRPQELRAGSVHSPLPSPHQASPSFPPSHWPCPASSSHPGPASAPSHGPRQDSALTLQGGEDIVQRVGSRPSVDLNPMGRCGWRSRDLCAPPKRQHLPQVCGHAYRPPPPTPPHCSPPVLKPPTPVAPAFQICRRPCPGGEPRP